MVRTSAEGQSGPRADGAKRVPGLCGRKTQICLEKGRKAAVTADGLVTDLTSNYTFVSVWSTSH